jgi:hypothetical protein
MEESLTCKYCTLLFKNKTTLKYHNTNSKKCMKIRGIKIESKYQCKGCNEFFVNKVNLTTHLDSCKKYCILQATNEYQLQLDIIRNKNNESIVQLGIDNQSNIDLLQKKHDKELFDMNHEINQLQKTHHSLVLDHQKQLDLIQKSHDKALLDAQNQIDKLQKIIENIATKAIEKPTTTINNQIRNCFSDKYFVEDIKEADIKRKCQSFLTEQILMEGQRGIARLCTEHIINTNDQKKLLISTDQSRNKFRYIDKNGNIKDDIEARTFIEKVSKPIKEVAEIVFDNVLSDIKDEKGTIEEDDYSRKAFLNDKELQANHSMVYIKCFDDPKHNSEFTNELAILNKNK